MAVAFNLYNLIMNFEIRKTINNFAVVKIEIIMKKKKRHDGVTDAVKAMRKGNREAEMELLGPGFHSKHAIHKSANIYTRKEKHKAKFSNESPSASLFVLRKRR